METCVECTHCRVVMTSWSAPGSPIRYYQCPFCQRTHSSLYGEVFARGAGARVLDARPSPPAAAGIPMPSQDDVRWANVKATAARWFARLEADERRCTDGEPPARPPRGEPDAPNADPADVVEIAAVGRRAG
ncbi:MAG TPA: hypothetical protein VFK90_00080 [Anaeromyxobacter sp.]|nr:hypothetical protein [Anaeromyxobacter sp.]